MDIQSYFTIFFLCLISILLLIQYHFKKPSKPIFHLPPAPPALPFIGHLHLLRPDIPKFLHNLSSKYGPFLYIRLGSWPVLVVSSSKFANEIFKTKDGAFSDKPIIHLEDGLFGNAGFFLSPYGNYWKFMKKLCVTQLLTHRQLERSHGVRCEELKRFLYKLVEKASRKEIVDVDQELTKLTNNIICRMVMSTSCSEEDEEAQRVRKLILEAIDNGGKMSIAAMLGPFKRLGFWVCKKQVQYLTREFNDLFEKIIKEHEEKDVGYEREDTDLLDILLDAYHDKNAEFKLTMNQMKASILDLFIGGTGTSSTTMQLIMAELINHPNVFKKVREEIESVVGINRRVQESDVPNLHYLQAVVKEAMRLHPVAPIIPRKCREDCKIEGFDIPKGTVVMVNAYSIMRDPNIWDNPNDFIPERFLEEPNIQKETKLQNFSFVPFGGGRRMCPGNNMALIVINITVASMVQCFDWKVDGDMTKVNPEVKAGLVVSMAHSLKCLPVVRFNPFSPLDPCIVCKAKTAPLI